MWTVAGYREVHAVLRDHERFSSASGGGLANLATNPYGWRKPSLLIETDPPQHSRYRAPVVVVFPAKMWCSAVKNGDVKDEADARTPMPSRSAR